MDTSATALIIKDMYIVTSNFNNRENLETSGPRWLDHFRRRTKPELKLNFQNLMLMAHVFAPFHMISQKSNYDVTFDQDLQRKLEINLDFQNNFVGCIYP